MPSALTRALVAACLMTTIAEGGQAVRNVASLPRFDVASIKENTSGSQQLSHIVDPGGGFTAHNTPLARLIARAYDIDSGIAPFLIIGGPAKVLATRFDVLAKPEHGVPQSDALLMLRALLADRFNLRVHHDTRPTAVYALTVARPGQLGPRLRRSTHDCNTWMANRRAGANPEQPHDSNGQPLCVVNPFAGQDLQLKRAAGIDDLVKDVQSLASVDRLIINMTELKGSYEWTLLFSRPESRASEAPSLFTALREQLGLALEPRIMPVKVLVIDAVSMPTPN